MLALSLRTSALLSSQASTVEASPIGTSMSHPNVGEWQSFHRNGLMKVSIQDLV